MLTYQLIHQLGGVLLVRDGDSGGGGGYGWTGSQRHVSSDSPVTLREDAHTLSVQLILAS